MSVLKTYRPGAVSAVFSQAASALGGFMAFLFLANMLSKDDFGAYSFAFNVMLLLSILATLGLDRALLLHLSRRGDPAGPKRGLRLLLAAVGLSSVAALSFMPLIWVLAVPLGQAKGSDVVHWWLSALAPVILPMAVLLILRAWLQANHRFAVAAAMPGVADFLRALFIGLAFVFLAGKPGVALAVFAAFALPTLALVLLVPGAARDRECRLERGDVSRGVVYAFQRITESGLNLFDVIIIGLVASDAITAEFALAARLAALADTGRLAVTPTFLPRARLHHVSGDQAALGSEYRWVRLLSLLSALAVAVVMLLFGPAILSLFGGYDAAFQPLLLLVAGYVVTAACGPHFGYLTMTGEVRLPALIRVGGLILTGVGVAVAVPVMGALGAGFAILLALVAVNGAALAALWLKTTFPGGSVRVHGLTLIAVLVLCAVALGGISPLLGAVVVLGVALGIEETEYGAVRRVLRRKGQGKGGA